MTSDLDKESDEERALAAFVILPIVILRQTHLRQSRAKVQAMAIYRVVHHDADQDVSWYGLHEVRFDNNGEIVWWDLEPSQFRCDGPDGQEEVAQALTAAAGDAGRWPALKATELPQ
jgi:hypothetical protein